MLGDRFGVAAGTPVLPENLIHLVGVDVLATGLLLARHQVPTEADVIEREITPSFQRLDDTSSIDLDPFPH